MKLRVVVHAIGWSIVFLAIVVAVLEALQMTFDRLSSWQQRRVVKVISPPINKRIPLAPKPVPLPPNYAVFAFCYHDFSERPNKWSIKPKRLEAHIQTLKALGFQFLTMGEAVRLLTGQWRGSVPKRAVVITVDDGFQSAYLTLFPLLKRYGVKATLFIYTDWIGKYRGALTWKQLQEMAQSGLVEIASHTVTHAYPRKLKRSLTSNKQYESKMEWEFVRSKTELEQKLGTQVEGLAYPGGYADGTLKALAKRAGYKWAAVINPEPFTVNFDRYAIPRYGVSNETTVAVLKAFIMRQVIMLSRLNNKTKPKQPTSNKAKALKFARVRQHNANR